MPKYTPDLTTLDTVKRAQGIGTLLATDDVLLTDYIHQASAWIQARNDRIYVPYMDSADYDARGNHITASKLDVDDLLAVGTLVNGDASVIASTAYTLYEPDADPKWRVQLLPSASVAFTYGTDPYNTIHLNDSWFGCVDNYARAFKSLTTLAGTLSTTDTAMIPVSTTPIEILGYSRLGAEIVQHTALSNGTVTISRNELGTSAAAHGAGTAVEVYQELPDIQFATTRIAQFMYDKRDTTGLRVQFADGSTVLEGEMPHEAMRVVMNRERRKVRVTSPLR